MVKQCEQVWNRDREELQWHTEWSCRNEECESPQCEQLRAEGFPTAYRARKQQALNRHWDASDRSEDVLDRTLRSMEKRHGVTAYE